MSSQDHLRFSTHLLVFFAPHAPPAQTPISVTSCQNLPSFATCCSAFLWSWRATSARMRLPLAESQKVRELTRSMRHMEEMTD